MTGVILLTLACPVQAAEKENTHTEIKGLTFDHSMELTYAEQFSVDYYKDGYALITIAEEGQFLVVPEGKEAPKDLDPKIAVIQKPVENIYLVATSADVYKRQIQFLSAMETALRMRNFWQKR